MIEFALEKKEAGPYWDRLLADKTKQHWLKIDFNKWKEEDESDDEEGGQNLEEVSQTETINLCCWTQSRIWFRVRSNLSLCLGFGFD